MIRNFINLFFRGYVYQPFKQGRFMCMQGQLQFQQKLQLQPPITYTTTTTSTTTQHQLPTTYTTTTRKTTTANAQQYLLSLQLQS